MILVLLIVLGFEFKYCWWGWWLWWKICISLFKYFCFFVSIGRWKFRLWCIWWFISVELILKIVCCFNNNKIWCCNMILISWLLRFRVFLCVCWMIGKLLWDVLWSILIIFVRGVICNGGKKLENLFFLERVVWFFVNLF